MEKQQFKEIRARLSKTQKEMAQLIGTSIKAVHSYEQGWRRVPHHVERQLLFLLFRRNENNGNTEKCWDILECPQELRTQCPAWEFHSGDLCWFINGTICSGKAHKTWQDKIEECRGCPVFAKLFKPNQDVDNKELRLGCPVLQE
ncbi:MAG: helix-turn-helix transcriptional regulator [Desulfobacterium sp.]|nr:helix-turn-helix transcriptional regulator [Desulfobacterium sp.]